MLDELMVLIPSYVLVLFRVGAMMMTAPMLGSTRLPLPVKVLLAMALSLGMAHTPPPVDLPTSMWVLAVGIAGEIMFGLAMGVAVSFVFVAAQFAGETISQQMGLHISASFDPQFGGQSSVIGDMYFMMCLVIFMSIGGHHDLLRGVHASFDKLPLLSVYITPSLLDLMVGLLHACMGLGLQICVPLFITMLVIDLAMGFLGKTMPQLNIMTAGLTVRAVAGFLVAIVSTGIVADLLSSRMTEGLDVIAEGYRGYLTPE